MQLNEILEYQKLDMQIRKIQNDLKNSEDRKNATKMKEYFLDNQSKMVALEESSASMLGLINKATASYNDMVKKIEDLLKSASGKEEADDIRAALESANALAQNCMKFERDAESLKIKLEKMVEESEQLAKNSVTAKNNFAVYKSRYDKLKKDAEPELAKLTAERDKIGKTVDSDLLAKYNQKVEIKSPVFVANTMGRCGRCQMEISGSKLKQLKEKGIIECENCGRYIYDVK